MADLFAADVANWANKTIEKQSEVLHESLRLLDVEIAENVPVVTGNLKNSREVSNLAPIAIDWKTRKFREPSDAINNAIAGVEVGKSAWLGFRAPYAHLLEPKYAFMRLGIQRWKQIADAAAAIVRGRS